jgi:hypothetical protein
LDAAEALESVNDFYGAELKRFDNLGQADEYLLLNNYAHAMQPPLAPNTIVLHCEETTFIETKDEKENKSDADNPTETTTTMVSTFATYDQPEPVFLGHLYNVPLERCAIDVVTALANQLRTIAEAEKKAQKPPPSFKLYIGTRRTSMDVAASNSRSEYTQFLPNALACLDTIAGLGDKIEAHRDGLLRPYVEYLDSIVTLHKLLDESHIKLVGDRDIATLYPTRVTVCSCHRLAIATFKHKKQSVSK